MDLFQWVLLVIGFAVIGIVYFISLKNNKSKTDAYNDSNVSDSDILFQEPGSDDQSLDEKTELLSMEPDLELEASTETSSSEFSDSSADLFDEEPTQQVDNEDLIVIGEPNDDEIDDIEFSHFFEEFNANKQSDSKPELNEAVSPEESKSESGLSDQTQTQTEAAAKVAPKQSSPYVLKGGVIVLHLKPKGKKTFWGDDVARVFADYNINYGDMDVYHLDRNEERLFTIINIVEPGTFDPEKISGQNFKGLTVLIQLNDYLAEEAVFMGLLRILGEVAEVLNATIFDNQHEPLTSQTVDHILNHIADNGY